jgi:hypothetical protein
MAFSDENTRLVCPYFAKMVSMKNMNIEDYLLWRGDIPFSRDPFNLVDAAVFNELAYVNFEPAGLLDCGLNGLTLREAGEIITEKDAYELKTLNGGEENFWKLAWQSERFGSVKIMHYEEVFDPERDAQFSAVHFRYGEDHTYVAFRGTDASIVGWREDFMISFTLTSSQKTAADYLQRTLNPGMNYLVGGHSKGGNLALYACAHLPGHLSECVEHLYVMDGPGFAPDVFDRSLLEPLLGKTTRLLPEFCIISRIYEVEIPDTRIIDCSGVATQQHDLITWLLDGPKFRIKDKTNMLSDKVMEVVMRWANSESIENRELFVNEVFDTLAASGSEDITKITVKGYMKVLDALSKTSPEAREVLADLGRTMIGADLHGREGESDA